MDAILLSSDFSIAIYLDFFVGLASLRAALASSDDSLFVVEVVHSTIRIVSRHGSKSDEKRRKSDVRVDL